jgi:hypothetical protein
VTEPEQAMPDQLRAREKPALEDLVLSLLLSGKSVGQVCAQTTMSRSALWRMRQRPEFQRRFQEARSEAFRGAVDALHSSALVFVRTLRDVCTDPGSRDSARASAARSGLDSLWNAAKLFDFEDRLRRLEDQANGAGK